MQGAQGKRVLNLGCVRQDGKLDPLPKDTPLCKMRLIWKATRERSAISALQALVGSDVDPTEETEG